MHLLFLHSLAEFCDIWHKGREWLQFHKNKDKMVKKLVEDRLKRATGVPLTLPKQQVLGSPKLKEFADDNFKYDENGEKFSKRVENAVGEKEKLLVTSNFSFSLSVFKSQVLQTCKKQGLFGKELIHNIDF